MGERKKLNKTFLLLILLIVTLCSLSAVYLYSSIKHRQILVLQEKEEKAIQSYYIFKNETAKLTWGNPPAQNFMDWFFKKKDFYYDLYALVEDSVLEGLLNSKENQPIGLSLEKTLASLMRETEVVYESYALGEYLKSNSSQGGFFMYEKIKGLDSFLSFEMKEQLDLIHIIVFDSQKSGFNRISNVSFVTIVLILVVIFLILYFSGIERDAQKKKFIRQYSLAMDVTIDALASLVELRDNSTGRHIEKTSQYVEIIGRELSKNPHFKNHLTENYLKNLARSSILHDIGKVGVPDCILQKPGALTEEEFEVIKGHCELGASSMRVAADKLPFESYIELAIQLIESHHESWDGSGYPRGLKGEDIPLSGRIMALADVYDAMRSKRVYKEPYPHKFCVDYIQNEEGQKFDPLVVKAFLKSEHLIESISDEEDEIRTEP